jgi:3-oxo-5-alpha-steroid 4-dehydrogenase 1
MVLHLHRATGEDSAIAEQQVNLAILWLWCAFALSAVALASGAHAPYGRYAADWATLGGLRVPTVPGIVDWWGHSCSILSMGAVWVFASHAQCTASWVNIYACLLFVAHYINRGPLFALRVAQAKPIPVPTLLMTTGFVLLNGWLQGTTLLRVYVLEPETAWEPRFWLGNALFFWGFYTNVSSDLALIALRKAPGPAYKIPRGGIFEYVSGANFLGEIVEWIGFGLICGTPASWTFAFTTACNIGPRAIHHHQWYLDKFGSDYPKSRKALIPFLL